MFKLKKYLKVITLSAAIVSLSSINAYSKGMLQLNRVQIDENTIEVKLEDVNTIVNSFQVSIKLEGDIKLDKIEFSKTLKDKAKTNYKYNKDKNIIDIYVTSKSNLVDKNGNINLGSIDIIGKEGTSYNITLNNIDGKNVFKSVSNTHKESLIQEGTITGKKQFVYHSNPSNTVPEEPEGSEEDTKPENPSDNVKPSNPGDNNTDSTSKPGNTDSSEIIGNPGGSQVQNSENKKPNQVTNQTNNKNELNKEDKAESVDSQSKKDNEIAINNGISNENDKNKKGDNTAESADKDKNYEDGKEFQVKEEGVLNYEPEEDNSNNTFTKIALGILVTGAIGVVGTVIFLKSKKII